MDLLEHEIHLASLCVKQVKSRRKCKTKFHGKKVPKYHEKQVSFAVFCLLSLVPDLPQKILTVFLILEYHVFCSFSPNFE